MFEYITTQTLIVATPSSAASLATATLVRTKEKLFVFLLIIKL
jgi:hypothetical protein